MGSNMEQTNFGNNAQYRILVVDDEPAVRTALVKALSLQGYMVMGAPSGEAALDLLRSMPFTLIVLDMHMPPGIDGVTVMRRAREIQPHLLIVVLTAHPSVDNAIAAVKSHAVDFLQKPVKTQALCDTVAKLLARHAERTHHDMLADAIASVIDTYGTAEHNEKKASVALSIRDNGDSLYISPLTFNYTQKLVMVDNSSDVIRLSDAEAVLLQYLMENVNQLLSARQLAFRLVGDGNLTEDAAQKLVRPYLSRLRAKLPVLKGPPPLLRTIRRRGYVFASRNTNFN